MSFVVLTLGVILACIRLTIAQSFEASCAALGANLAIPDVNVNFVEYIPQGTNVTFPYNDPTCTRPFQIASVDLCRLATYITTSNTSGVYFEAWLPRDWNGRFLSTGNGGTNGCIQYEDLSYTAGLGFAAVGANNGHNGTSGKTFLNNPGVVEDFAWRSVHTGVVVGKQITTTFYQQDFTKSYYLGCSTGGRQGIMTAQRFPGDFDGIVAGAPALDYNDLTSWSGWLGVVTGFDNTSAGFVTKSLWARVHQEILRQCDGMDGAVDGVIEDPDLCYPIFETLLCKSNTTNTTNCLNGEQVKRVRAVFSPLYGLDGSLIYPRMQPGSEITASAVYYTGAPFLYTTEWFRYAIYSNASWDPTTLSLEDVMYARDLDLFNISSFNGDLSAFRNAGGKLLHYHGLQDPIISSDNSERYYNHVADTMSVAPSDLDAFYRYFRISGMGHCYGGPGAWEIGQRAIGATTLDSQNNVLLRMVDWVENGNPPESVTGTKYVNDTKSLGTSFVRKHCKYPTRNVYVGPANYTDQSAWKCV